MRCHDYHEALPGYHPDQILHDGCEECEHQAENVERALGNLDEIQFGKAWRRAADLFATTPPSGDRGGPRSAAEVPLLAALWGVQYHLFYRGWPYGFVPESHDYHEALLRDVSRPDLSHLTPGQTKALQLALKGLEAIVDRDGWIRVVDLAWGEHPDASEAVLTQEGFHELRAQVSSS